MEHECVYTLWASLSLHFISRLSSTLSLPVCYNFIVFVRIAKPSETKATNQCHTFLPMHRAIATNAIAAKLSKNHQITSFVTQNNSLGYISKCVSHRGWRFRVQRPPRNKNHLLAHIFLFFLRANQIDDCHRSYFHFFCDPKINFRKFFVSVCLSLLLLLSLKCVGNCEYSRKIAPILLPLFSIVQLTEMLHIFLMPSRESSWISIDCIALWCAKQSTNKTKHKVATK